MRNRDLIPVVLLFSAALGAFTWIAAMVETGGTLASIDAWIDSWLHLHAIPSITEAMIVISFLGAPSTLTVVSAVVCVALLRKRSYDRLVDMVTLFLGGNLLNYGLKHLIHRGRPTFDNPLLTLSSYSFPSGHAMASTVFYGFVIGCVLSMTGPRRNAAIAAGIVMIGFVCLSRVYLGVHYASDVLAGILEAIAWSTLVLTSLRLARVCRRNAGSQGQIE
jgi:membrane-associated phospholipid phosphatase